MVSHGKVRCVFFKPWELSLSQFFRIQSKAVWLELFAPVCKREKSSVQHFGSFLPEVSLLAVDGNGDRSSPKLPSIAGVNLPLTDTGVSALAFSILSARGTDGMPD